MLLHFDGPIKINRQNKKSKKQINKWRKKGGGGSKTPTLFPSNHGRHSPEKSPGRNAKKKMREISPVITWNYREKIRSFDRRKPLKSRRLWVSDISLLSFPLTSYSWLVQKKKAHLLLYFIYNTLFSVFFIFFLIDPTVGSGLLCLMETFGVRFYYRLHNTWFLQ